MKRGSTRISRTWRRRCATGRIVRTRFAVTGFRKGRASGARSGFRPCAIGSSKPRYVWCLEPIFDATFAPHSYGFRPGRGAKGALRRVAALLQAGYHHVVDADLQAYFDTIPHAPLRVLVASKVSDGRVLALVDAFLQQPIFEGLAQWTADEGTPQGAVDHAPYAKGNFQFERVIASWRDRPVLDLRRK